jgi:hypothetical protein
VADTAGEPADLEHLEPAVVELVVGGEFLGDVRACLETRLDRGSQMCFGPDRALVRDAGGRVGTRVTGARTR